jgi:hypothetical protein
VSYAWFTDPDTGRQHYRHVPTGPEPARGNFPTPRIAGDNIEVRSMVDGQTYTSKAALRQHYRREGFIEVGNEDVTKHIKPVRKDRSKERRESIAKAFNRVGISVG